MKLLRGLLLKPTLNLLIWVLRRNGNSLIIGGPLGWSWQATIDTAHHGPLAGPANAHRHSDLADIGIDNHHARDHATRHQNGGADEIGVAGLSGELADEQKSAFTKVTGRWPLAQAHRGALDKIMVFKGPAADPVEEDMVKYTEDSVDGATTDAYADALDVDTRGMKSFSAVVKNTDGANSLNWRLRARPSNYSAGVDEEIPECPGEETLAFGEKGLAELLKAYSRIKIQVKSTLALTPATYTIDYLINY